MIAANVIEVAMSIYEKYMEIESWREVRDQLIETRDNMVAYENELLEVSSDTCKRCHIKNQQIDTVFVIYCASKLHVFHWDFDAQ